MKLHNDKPTNSISKYTLKLKNFFLMSILLALLITEAAKAQTTSLCSETKEKIECPYQKTTVDNREVLFSIPPISNASKNKIPVVLFFPD